MLFLNYLENECECVCIYLLYFRFILFFVFKRHHKMIRDARYVTRVYRPKYACIYVLNSGGGGRGEGPRESPGHVDLRMCAHEIRSYRRAPLR